MDQVEAVIYQFPMAEKSRALAKTDESGATPVPVAEATKSDGREFLASTQRRLTLEEAASAAGIQWFQYEIRRLDRETDRLQTDLSTQREKYDSLTTQFTDKRVEFEALKGSATASKRNEILSTLTIAAGSAGIGAVPGYLEVPAAHELAVMGLGVSAVLVVAGIVLRMWK